MPDAEELRGLLVDAAFHGVHIRQSVMTIRLPPVEAFALGHLASTPAARAVAGLSEEEWTALVREVRMALQPYADGNGLSLPDETIIAIAHT